MLHFDAKAPTYQAFFSHVADVLATPDVPTEIMTHDQLVFGSDEEKAIIKAIKAAFPNASHIFCYRHIEENVRRHLTEVGTSISESKAILDLLKQCSDIETAADSETIEHKKASLMKYIRIHHAQLEDYFHQHVFEKINHNMMVSGVIACNKL